MNRSSVIVAFSTLVALAVLMGCGLGAHYVQATNSMMPKIGIGDHMAAVNPTLAPIKRFDIVAYKSQATTVNMGQGGQSVWYVHRVIGMPNEEIEVRQAKVYINGKLIEEPFEHIEGGKDFPPTAIPENEYFLMGDNRPNSLDSRYWVKPTISGKDITGVVTTIIKKADYDNGKRW